MPTDRAQDTEAIRAARLDGLVAQIWDAYRDDAYGSSFQMKIAAYWPELAAERDRLVARLEAAERALQRIADAGTGIPDWRSMADCARAALAAAAPGETERTP